MIGPMPLALKVPPVLLVLVTAALMWLASWAVPALGVTVPGRRLWAAGLGIAGVILCSMGLAAFRRARTTVDPTRPHASSSLVQTGIYARTRNPMYLGFLLMLTAWAVFLSNVMALIFVPLFVACMNRFPIAPEESALAGLFGREFSDYKSRVRRGCSGFTPAAPSPTSNASTPWGRGRGTRRSSARL
jgi:protein-S-isoprenylcysteine O-methyltransferase Ste14